MATKIQNSQINTVFKGLLEYLYSKDNLHSIIIQPNMPITFMGYDKNVQYSNDVILDMEQTGELARTFIHDDAVKKRIKESNVGYEIYQDGNRLVMVTIMRNDTKLSLVVTARKTIESLTKNFNFNLNYVEITNKKNTSEPEKETNSQITLTTLMPQIIGKTGPLIITGENIYYNNIVGLQILDAINNHGKFGTPPQKRAFPVITTLENPIYADINRNQAIFYRHQYLKDICDLNDLLLNNILMSQTNVLYINQPSMITSNNEAKTLFKTMENSKLCIIVEDNKSIKDVLKEYYNSNELFRIIQIDKNI